MTLRHVDLAASAGAALRPASEVQASMALGLTWLKASPASVPGAERFRARAGPFPEARFVATGGVDAANANAFLTAGVRTVALSSALEDPTQLTASRRCSPADVDDAHGARIPLG